MTIAVLNSDSAHAELGPSFRRSQPGPESDMISSFLDGPPTLTIPRNCAVTIFCEPKLEVGFPDLVIVIWHVPTASRWQRNRALLAPSDHRLLHYIHQVGRTESEELHLAFGTGTAESLDRLHEAELIRRTGTGWTPRALSRTFAARRIIAIEAKIAEWTSAVEQATRNTWFASESYVLVPHVPRRSELLERAALHGVGVITAAADFDASVEPLPGTLPSSYASWLFNDWAWRASLAQPPMGWGT